jgi:hypothetical protein
MNRCTNDQIRPWMIRMTDVDRVEEKSRMRQFWLRVLLVLGLLLGGMPFITAPLAFGGMNETPLDVFAAVFNGFTVLPACALAFWHRRGACIWLTVNAATMVTAISLNMERTRHFNLGALIGAAGPVFVALCLDYMELRRWPAALNR